MKITQFYPITQKTTSTEIFSPKTGVGEMVFEPVDVILSNKFWLLLPKVKAIKMMHTFLNKCFVEAGKGTKSQILPIHFKADKCLFQKYICDLDAFDCI